MTEPQSPSPIVEAFVRAVRREFPEDEQAKLTPHHAAVAQTTSKGDSRRARRCAEWAIRKADDKDRSHPRWKELKEIHRIWKDTWFGDEFGLTDHYSRVAGKPETFEDVKIEWVEDAVMVAKALGEEDGWENSPWEKLLVELIEIDGPDQRG
jgi:hypothetical protein